MQFKSSLVVLWWESYLPMQGTRVQPLLWEDSTSFGATKPACHSSETCAPKQEKPLQQEDQAQQPESSPCSPRLEKGRAQQRPRAAKINKKIFKELYLKRYYWINPGER